MQDRETGNSDEKRRGCILVVGDVVDLHGGLFRIDSIGKRFVRLRGLPGTKVFKAEMDVAIKQAMDEVERKHKELT